VTRYASDPIRRRPRHGLGIVGAGVIGAIRRGRALIPEPRLVAVTDAAPERARALADAYGCAAEPDLDAFLGRTDVDVVSVCAPSGLHAKVGRRAAAAGKHLAIEKPIDVTLAAADRLIAAARAAGVTMTVIAQHRFDPGRRDLAAASPGPKASPAPPVCSRPSRTSCRSPGDDGRSGYGLLRTAIW